LCGFDTVLRERNNVTNTLGQSSIVYSLVDGKIILKWILKTWVVGGMDWIALAQDRERWRSLVNAVINLRVLYNAGNFLIS
jgi:hypothetical protein